MDQPNLVPWQYLFTRGIVIFLLFLLLRGLISNFILKRLQNYVDKTTNKFDDALVKASTGPIKFLPIVLGIFVASSYMEFDGKMLVFVDNINRSLIINDRPILMPKTGFFSVFVYVIVLDIAYPKNLDRLPIWIVYSESVFV